MTFSLRLGAKVAIAASGPSRMGGRSARAGTERTTAHRVAIAGAGAVTRAASLTIVVVDRRVLIRECLVKCLRAATENCVVAGFAALSEWHEAAGSNPATVLILCPTEGEDDDAERELAYLSQEGITVPAIIVSDGEDVDHILAALENGAKGYIPTSMPLDVAVKAMRLVEAGGTFVPASSLFSSRRREDDPVYERQTRFGQFTARQVAVIERLRQGKANKQIAYELNMCEGTVKVHVRNIMKKLKARNRTEVAFLIHALAGGEGH
jgi:DNA-binding NarL/FixJ family response regulator